MVRKVVGKMYNYNSDEDTEAFVKWWKNNSNLIPGVKRTEDINGELAIYYNFSDASKARTLVDSLKQIV